MMYTIEYSKEADKTLRKWKINSADLYTRLTWRSSLSSSSPCKNN